MRIQILWTHGFAGLLAGCLVFSGVAAQGLDGLYDRLAELTADRTNIGAAAGYSVDGEVIWTGGSGLRCRDEDAEFTPATRTRIASIAKNMTAVAVLQLVEQGRLDLDVPIQTYLPSFPIKEKGSITTRHLLAHTSGISQYRSNRERENRTEYPTLADAMAVFEDRPLMFEPGSRYFYTSYGYVVLGRIIEEVSGLGFEAYMRERIWEPADMRRMGVEREDRAVAEQACLYHRDRRRGKPARRNNLSNRIPGGGFYSTVEDLLKFGDALVQGRLISDASLEIMLQRQPVEYDGNLYGLGWYFYGPTGAENLVIGHGGGQTGCTSQLMIIPRSKTVVAVLSNTSNNYPQIATLASTLIQSSERRMGEPGASSD